MEFTIEGILIIIPIALFFYWTGVWIKQTAIQTKLENTEKRMNIIEKMEKDNQKHFPPAYHPQQDKTKRCVPKQ